MYTFFFHILTLLSTTHDIHLSKTELHYRSDQKALQCTVHLFIDDLENAIQMDYGIDSLYFFTKREYLKSDSIIRQYINDNLVIQIDNNLVQPILIGKEMSEDLQGVYCYLEVENLSDVKKMQVDNTIMLNLFDNQKNIVDVKKDRKGRAHWLMNNSATSKQVRL